jgi:membrane-bound metal-dependent hydrolase YbcI (DUF457 family)
MPSPVGHALAGAAAGWLVAPRGKRNELLRWGGIFALAGTAADLDLLARVHRGPSHSLAAALAAGVAAWVVWAAISAWRNRRDAPRYNRIRAVRLAFAVSIAYATHTLLDWLGVDTWAPFGIMALWPVTDDYYQSSWHIFLAVSRRYWLPDFWTLNLHALVRELAILGPIAAAAGWWRWRRSSA